MCKHLDDQLLWVKLCLNHDATQQRLEDVADCGSANAEAQS